MTSPTRFTPATKIPGVFFRHDANCVSYGARVVHLTAVEADFLAALWNVYPMPMGVDDLLLAVYGGNEGDGVTRSNVSMYVQRLGKKLKFVPIEVVLNNSTVVLRPRSLRSTAAGPSWTPQDYARLAVMWPVASWTEMLVAFPGRSRMALRLQAGRMRVRRRRQPLESGRCADPLIQDLIAARIAQGLSQIDLAKRIGTVQTKVAGWERKGVGFSTFMLRAWCDALGVELRAAAKEHQRKAG